MCYDETVKTTFPETEQAESRENSLRSFNEICNRLSEFQIEKNGNQVSLTMRKVFADMDNIYSRSLWHLAARLL